MKTNPAIATAVWAAITLTACGGGGGGASVSAFCREAKAGQAWVATQDPNHMDLNTIAGRYDTLAMNSPAEIKLDVETMAKGLHAAAAHQVGGAHPNYADARKRIDAYAKDKCGLEVIDKRIS